MANIKPADALQEFTLPAYREIPDVGLYLDQVVKYINGFFRDFPEMNVTSSMVSNYVKSKLISSPYKKTYSRDQIGALIFIVITKTVLSMDHIRMCLSEYDALGDVEKSYEIFRDEMLQVLKSFTQDSKSGSRKKVSEERIVLNNIVITVAHKMYLDRFFESKKEN